MKFTCATSDLMQALHLVSRAISSQQALPILGNVLLEAEGKRCTISATDLELSIITGFEAQIENEGSITVPAKALLNFAQYNSDPEVVLETSEGTHLRCTSAHAKAMIAGEGAAEYPTIPSVERETTLRIDAAPLLDALHMVTFASAKTSLRPVLSGVYLRSEKGYLVFVATDSYRLSEYKIAVQDVPDISCIIPTKVLEELRAVLGAKKSDRDAGENAKNSTPSTVEILLSSQQIELHVGPTRLLSRLIDGKFPDYQQIIPKEDATTIFLQTKELLTAVRRMHYFAKETNNNLTFHFKDGAAYVHTPQTQGGKDEATLTVEIRGAENKIALSSSYLLDYLGHADGDTLEMRLSDSMHPAVFRAPNTEHCLHLIMPLRIQES